MKIKKAAAICICLAVFLCACNGNGDSELSSGATSDVTEGDISSSVTEAVTQEETKREIKLVPVTADDIPEFSGGTKKTVYDCGDGVFMRHVTMVIKSEFEAYLNKLSGLGFVVVNERVSGNTRFVTLAKDGMSLIASYFDNDKSVRVIALPYDPYESYSDIYLPPAAVPDAAEPLFTMVATNFTSKINGMSYIIRTPAGSFIIIDGGWSGEGEAKKILDILNSQKLDDGIPVVAAWIITHPHSDHVGAIADMASVYYDEIRLERVICNFVNDELMLASDAKAMLNAGSGSVTILRSALASPARWGNADNIKPHTGDVLYIDGVTLEILHTHEDVYPETDALLYNNANSTAFRLSAGGHSALILGDLSGKYMNVIADRYGSGLSADILQPTHHGRTHGSVSVYKLVSPSIVMWDASLASYNEYKNETYNKYLIENIPRHYISENGTVTVSMKTLEEIK